MKSHAAYLGVEELKEILNTIELEALIETESVRFRLNSLIEKVNHICILSVDEVKASMRKIG